MDKPIEEISILAVHWPDIDELIPRQAQEAHADGEEHLNEHQTEAKTNSLEHADKFQ